MDDDLELLERWCGGDNNAGNQLFQRHFAGVYRFFRNKLPDAADELVQATFLACVKSRDRFRGQSSFRTYIFAIARNELFAYLRKVQRRRDDLDFDQVSMADLGTSPTGRLARDQERQRLLQALCTLPVEQQVLLELFYWEGMSTAELAEVLGIAEPAGRTRLSRARKALRERMETLAGAAAGAPQSLEDLDAWARRLRERS